MNVPGLALKHSFISAVSGGPCESLLAVCQWWHLPAQMLSVSCSMCCQCDLEVSKVHTQPSCSVVKGVSLYPDQC